MGKPIDAPISGESPNQGTLAGVGEFIQRQHCGGGETINGNQRYIWLVKKSPLTAAWIRFVLMVTAVEEEVAAGIAIRISPLSQPHQYLFHAGIGGRRRGGYHPTVYWTPPGGWRQHRQLQQQIELAVYVTGWVYLR